MPAVNDKEEFLGVDRAAHKFVNLIVNRVGPANRDSANRSRMLTVDSELGENVPDSLRMFCRGHDKCRNLGDSNLSNAVSPVGSNGPTVVRGEKGSGVKRE